MELHTQPKTVKNAGHALGLFEKLVQLAIIQTFLFRHFSGHLLRVLTIQAVGKIADLTEQLKRVAAPLRSKLLRVLRVVSEQAAGHFVASPLFR